MIAVWYIITRRSTPRGCTIWLASDQSVQQLVTLYYRNVLLLLDNLLILFQYLMVRGHAHTVTTCPHNYQSNCFAPILTRFINYPQDKWMDYKNLSSVYNETKGGCIKNIDISFYLYNSKSTIITKQACKLSMAVFRCGSTLMYLF